MGDPVGRSEIVPSVLSTIGGTPIVPLNRIQNNSNDARVWVKLESENPGGSIKDRIALAMIDAAEKSGVLQQGGSVVEATSGNTGISLAMVCAAKGYQLFLIMPEGMSIERRAIFAMRGAKCLLVPSEASIGMLGATEMAKKLAEQNGYFYVDQFANPVNALAHEQTTGPEIVSSFLRREKVVDVFVAGTGTGGTLTGCARCLRKHFPACRTIAVEPRGSPVLSGGSPGRHSLQGIGPGFVPTVLDRSLIGGIELVGDHESLMMSKSLAALEGIFCGPSGGANVAAALRVARGMGSDKNIVTIIPDTGERYLSTFLPSIQQPSGGAVRGGGGMGMGMGMGRVSMPQYPRAFAASDAPGYTRRSMVSVPKERGTRSSIEMLPAPDSYLGSKYQEDASSAPQEEKNCHENSSSSHDMKISTE